MPLDAVIFPGQAQYLNGIPAVGNVGMTIKRAMKQHIAGFNGKAARKA
jgi:hypothetical protein